MRSHAVSSSAAAAHAALLPRSRSTPAIQGVWLGAVLCSARKAAANGPRWFTAGAFASACTLSQHSLCVWFQMSGDQHSGSGHHTQLLQSPAWSCSFVCALHAAQHSAAVS
jgi:hypothetical protein